MLVEEWGGWHRVKGDEKEEEVPSSLGEARAVNSQEERVVRENRLDENKMLEMKAEMREDEQQKDNHEKLRKRGVEDGKKTRKPGVPKSVAEKIGAKKKQAKKRKGKQTKKRKKQQKSGTKMKSKRNIRDTECIEKWAAYTSVVIGLAPTVIKQVDKCLFLQIMKQFQVNSILASDKTLRRKKSKQDDFLEHQSILQQALTANPCDGGNANGKSPTPQSLSDLKLFQVCLTP